jgi:hypothetical protein
MNVDDRVLYRIQISGLAKNTIQSIASKIGFSQSEMIITADTIIIPRLNTRWRGDASEAAWQADLRRTVGDAGTVLFDVQPWSHADGYPKGETEL